jgi:ATP adenylyltransferase
MAVTRFDNILSRAPAAPVYDSVLLDLGEVVVAPTLGSIIPHWVLAIPKSRSDNMSQWCGKDRASPLKYITKITRLLGRAENSVIWFEHGPTTRGSVTGCGIDHAHIHILLHPAFEFSQFKATAIDGSSLAWECGYGNPYDSIARDESYLVASSGGEFILARSVEAAGSQFFRRVIAHLAGEPSTWDYKLHPHHDNVAKTVAVYGGKAA